MLFNYLVLSSLYLATFLVFNILAKMFNLFDQPDTRKIHSIPVPYIGGSIIFFIIFILTFFKDYPFELNYLIYTSSIVFMIGFLDDKFNLNPLIRLFFQFCSSVIILGSGVFISSLGYYKFIGNVELYYFSYIITIFCIIISINSFNFIDGIDGLCSGVFLSSMFLINFYCFYYSLDYNYMFIYDIAFIVFCFFVCNYFFKSFKIFLGDSGSNLLGFYLSVSLIYFTQVSSASFHPVLAIWVLAIPVFDFFSILVMRVFYLKINPMKSDKKHIHHLLMSRNCSTKIITIILVSLNLILGLLGLVIYNIFGSLICLFSYLVIFLIYLYLTRFVISNIKN